MLLKRLLIIVLFLSSFHALAETNTEKEQRNIRTLMSWGIDVWEKGHLELVPELLAPEYIRHEGKGNRTVTPESYIKEIQAGRAKGWKFDANAISVDGDLIWTRWTVHGKNEDGSPATGKGIQIYRLENGKIAETWVLFSPGEW